jgi:NADH-quinone oxidoreductase subunit F
MKQERRVLAKCGRIDPTQVSHYIAGGGYSALAKVLSKMTPEAGHRRNPGGQAARPRRRRIPHRAEMEICPPGAGIAQVRDLQRRRRRSGRFHGPRAAGRRPPRRDRRHAHRRLCHGRRIQGYIYVREEYPIAVEHLTIAVEQLRELGLLGENILGTGFRLPSLH